MRIGKYNFTGYIVAVLAVGLVSAVIALAEPVVGAPGLAVLYLLAVLFVATRYGRGPAILASVLEFLLFDFLFVNPRHDLTVADPAEWVTLLVFLTIGVVTSHLAAAERERAREAEQREREAVTLYDISRAIRGRNLDDTLQNVAGRLFNAVPVQAIRISVSGISQGTAGDVFALNSLDVKEPVRILGESTEGSRWVRVISPARLARRQSRVSAVPIRAGETQVGTITLLQADGAAPFRQEEVRLLSATAVQIGAAIERERLRKEATEAEILRRTDALKTSLINAVSHDLRTPLASIMAAAGSLRQTDVQWTGDETREFAQDIENEARRLGRIVDNLLDLSRIESGTLQPERAWHDLGTLLGDVLLRLRSVTQGFDVRLSVPESLPPVSIDAIEIDQVVSNLIENATKYAPPGTPIDVRVSQHDGMIDVEVADRGPGIPAAALDQIFQPFYRAEADGPRPRGAGVGLAVARGLVEAHGGTIRAANRPDGGARFSFTLPIVRHAAPVA